MEKSHRELSVYIKAVKVSTAGPMKCIGASLQTLREGEGFHQGNKYDDLT